MIHTVRKRFRKQDEKEHGHLIFEIKVDREREREKECKGAVMYAEIRLVAIFLIDKSKRKNPPAFDGAQEARKILGSKGKSGRFLTRARQ